MATKETLTVTIVTENAAFEDGGLYTESARILREIADKVESGDTPYSFKLVRDINGNGVARYRLRPENYPD